MLPHSRRPPCCRAGRLVAQFQEEPAAGQFDPSSEQFDLLSLRSFRRDALLQYDATNQSEPLRIALTLLGILFALAYPSLLADTPGLQPADPTLTTAGSAFGAVGCAFLFQQNRAARASRIERISREYALGDLTATFRGVRTARLREMRGKLRFVILVGPSAAVAAALREAHVYRRRLTTASTAVVPVYSDGEPRGAPEACPAYLWTAAAPADWLAYYSELLQRRGLGAGGAAGECAWIGINMKGRTFGSALGKPRRALPPSCTLAISRRIASPPCIPSKVLFMCSNAPWGRSGPALLEHSTSKPSSPFTCPPGPSIALQRS
jgi:HAMP domain-containing protein